MEILTRVQAKKIERVLLTKIKHSKYTGGGEEEDTHFKELGFKFSTDGKRNNPYLKDLFPSIYYEWSKRQNEEYKTLFLNCVFVRNSTIYKNVNLEFFEPSTFDVIERLKKIDEFLKQFHFEDMKVYLLVQHPLNTLIWFETELKNFLYDETENEINREIEKFNQKSGRSFRCFDDEDLRGRVKQHQRRISKLEEEHDVYRQYNQRLLFENKILRERPQSDKTINGIKTVKEENCVICYEKKNHHTFL